MTVRAARPVASIAALRPSTIRVRFSADLRGHLTDGFVALAFWSVLAVQISQHAMWRDELNAWGIVLASRSLGDLLYHMHYEGHPGLWHLILWTVSHVSSAPRTIQIIQGAVGFGIIAMIAFASPFNRLEKLLLLLSYFLLFEYAVPSRNYGIGVLLAFLYARERSARFNRVKTLAALLGLLANTNIFCFILSGALTLEYLAAAFGDNSTKWSRTAWKLAPAGLIYGAALLIALATFWPAPDISWRTTGAPMAGGLTVPHLTNVLINYASALLPLSQQAFWAPQSMIDSVTLNAERLAIGVSAPLLLAGLTRIFAAQRGLLLIPAITILGSVLFSLVFYDGYARHWGIGFVATIVAFWIYRANGHRPSPFSWALLSVNAAAGLVFTLQHWAVPFSNATPTAAWLSHNIPADAVLVGTPDTHVAAVAEIMGKPAYFLDCRCSDTFLFFQRRRDDFTLDDVPARLAESLERAGARPLVFVSGRPLEESQRNGLTREGLTLTRLAHFDGALVENFEIFAVTKAGSAPQPSSLSALPRNEDARR